MTEQPATGKEVETERARFAPEDLRSLATLEDAVRLIEREFGGVADATTEIGDGFTMLEEKDKLLNVPMVVMQWVFATGDYTRDGERTEYVIARILTEHAEKFIVTDGGTGICAQLREYEARTGRTGGLMCGRGLRKSEYDTVDGVPTTDKSIANGRGETFYLNV